MFILKNFTVIEQFILSLTDRDLAALNADSDDYLIISRSPMTSWDSIAPPCVSNYSERSFNFDLTACDHKCEVRKELISHIHRIYSKQKSTFLVKSVSSKTEFGHQNQLRTEFEPNVQLYRCDKL